MVAATDDRNDHMEVLCNSCAKSFTIFYNRQDMVQWLSGSKYIQDALSYLEPYERELLLSGLCDSCFNSMFSPLDNDE